jgi:hypothetical protein
VAYLCWVCELGDGVSRDWRHCVYHKVCLCHSKCRGCSYDERSEMHDACGGYRRRGNNVEGDVAVECDVVTWQRRKSDGKA